MLYINALGSVLFPHQGLSPLAFRLPDRPGSRVAVSGGGMTASRDLGLLPSRRAETPDKRKGRSDPARSVSALTKAMLQSPREAHVSFNRSQLRS